MRFRPWMFVLIPVGIAAFLGAAVTAVWALWNATVPPIFHGPSLLWWQAAAVLALARLLFGAFGGGGHRGWKKHHRGHGGGHCAPHRGCCDDRGDSMRSWWETRGRADFDAWRAERKEKTDA